MADAAGSDAVPFEGVVEGGTDGVVRGWAWFPNAPEQPATVHFIIDGVTYAERSADQARADLETAGKRGGKCAFTWRPPQSHELSVFVRLPDGRDLDGSPVLVSGVDPFPPFEGAVETATRTRVTGWVWIPDFPDRAVTVELYADGARVASQSVAPPRRATGAASEQTRRFDIKWQAPEGTEARHLDVRLADGRELAHFDFDPLTQDQDVTYPLPLRGFDGYLECLGDKISGWAAPVDRGPHIVFSACEGDVELFTVEAKDWRQDLEDSHQGDGRGGFDVTTPNVLRDGKVRFIDLRADGHSVLPHPLRVWLPPAPGIAPSLDLTAITRKVRMAVSPLHFSFVVNFYNMRREAARTLLSLTRAYQRDSEDIKYEVICVDNGSNPPLDEDWVKSFGPEFRLVRPSKPHPSPVFAINEAAQQARGRHLAIMVDGAHLLTPGVLREAKDAIDEAPNAVVAVRHWFVGGDQRWLSAAGYQREMEDILFARIGWPQDGYRLFEIGSPMHETPSTWVDGLSESNCLILPAKLWRRIGGMDEAFSVAGGGFCNLDLLRRAAEGEGAVTALMGEASFHQFHEGTTTNVNDAEKESRVRSYANVYRHLRGEHFASLPIYQIRLRGQMHNVGATVSRQRPLFPAPLGVTGAVRPGPIERWIDIGANTYLNGVYAEAGLHERTRWRGERVDLAPGDLTALQEILREVRPERIVITADEPGLIGFLSDMAKLESLDDMRIVCVVDATPPAPRDRVDYIVGAPYAPETIARVTAAIGAIESTLVLFSPRADDHYPLDALRLYSEFVSFGSYMVVLRTVLGQPWLGYSTHWLKRSIFLFLQNSGFVTDETRTRHIISMCTAGYLARVKPPKPSDEIDMLDAQTS